MAWWPKVLVKSGTNQFLKDALVKVQLIDEEDAHINDKHSEENIPANGYGMFETSFYGVNKFKLRNTTIKISLYIYSDVKVESVKREFLSRTVIEISYFC